MSLQSSVQACRQECSAEALTLVRPISEGTDLGTQLVHKNSAEAFPEKFRNTGDSNRRGTAACQDADIIVTATPSRKRAACIEAR